MVSTVYRYGSSIASDVDVTDRSNRVLGNVTVDGFNDAVDITNDSARDLGQTWVQNEVDVDLAAQTGPNLATNLDAVLTANATDELRVTSPSSVTFDVSASSALPVHSPNALDVSAATVPTEQQTPVGVEDATGTQLNPAESEPQGNWPNGYDDSVDLADTTVTALPTNPVPDGVVVVVQADPGNNDPVKVGLTNSPTVKLTAGQSFECQPTDLSQVRVQAVSSGQTVNVTHEVN